MKLIKEYSSWSGFVDGDGGLNKRKIKGHFQKEKGSNEIVDYGF